MNYILKRSKRKTLSIKINAKAELIVLAPMLMPKIAIDAFVLSKKKWIEEKQAKFKDILEEHPLPIYKNGAEHYYLGEKYQLNIIETNKLDVSLDEAEKTIHISTEYVSPAAIEDLLYQFYKFRSREVFQKELDTCFMLFSKYRLKKPSLKVRRMKSMWGNCRPHTGIVTLNTELVRADINCIKYVVIHELCHLIHANHSTDFYNLQAEMFQDWESCKELLNTKFSIRS